MYELRQIVVGLALEPIHQKVTAGSRRAVDRALWLARATGARVELVHAVAGDLFIREEGKPGARPAYGLSEEGRLALEDIRREFLDAGITTYLTFRPEKPAVAVIRQVLNQSADLVIVGKHDVVGRGAKLGSVSRRLVRDCPCPVWVVKADGQSQPLRVLAATDLEDVGGRAIELAATFCELSGAELHVAHAWQYEMADQIREGVVEGDPHADRGAQALEDTRRQVEEHAHGVPAQLHVGRNSPVRCILDGVEFLQADLLVLGTYSRVGVRGFLFGNTAEKVMTRVDGSLLVVKPEGFSCPLEMG